MKIMKKLMCLIVSSVVISSFSMSVCADSSVYETSRYDTCFSIADVFLEEYQHSVYSNLSFLCGGDVGVYFYTTSVGLQDSFVKSTSRKVIAHVKEYDSSTSNTLARTREGTFGMVNGYYRPQIWGYTYTNSNMIESDSTAELRLVWKVESVSGDTSTSIPSALMKYSLWVYV